ncbi:hypothetical protein V8E53_014535 [Lactarius tabidus]
MSPVLSIPLVPASCTKVFPEPEHASSFSSAPSHIVSSCMNVIPEPEPVSDHAFSSSFPSTSPPELMPSHIPPSLTCSPAKVQLPELASLLTSTSSNTVDHSKIASVPEPEFTLMSPLSDPSTRLPANRAPSPSTIDTPPAVYPSSKLPPAPLCFTPVSCELACGPKSTPTSAVNLFSLSRSESSLKSYETIPFTSAHLEVSNAAVPSRLKSQERMHEVTPHNVTPAVTPTTLLPTNAQLRLPSSHSDRSHVSPRPLSTVEISSSNSEPPSLLGKVLPVSPTPLLGTSWNAPSYANSSPLQPPPVFEQGNSPSVSLEATLNVPAPPHSTPPQQPLRVTPVDLECSLLEIRPALASSATPSIPQPHPFEVTSQVPMQHLVPHWLELQHPPLVHEDSSPLVLCHSHSSPLLPSTPARIKFALSLVTTAVLVLALANVSAIIPTRSRKLWRKNEEISNDRGDVTISGKTFDFAQLFQLVQYKLHAARLVFDPGGFTFTQQSPHEDAHEHKPKTHNTARTLLSSLAATFVTCI